MQLLKCAAALVGIALAWVALQFGLAYILVGLAWGLQQVSEWYAVPPQWRRYAPLLGIVEPFVLVGLGLLLWQGWRAVRARQRLRAGE